MRAIVTEKDATYLLNHCTRFLARDNEDARHDYGQYEAGDPRARISEAWRFPIIDSFYDGHAYKASHEFNIVTFVYVNRDGRLGNDIAVTGTFMDLYAAVPLTQVEDSVYWSATIVVPKGQWHLYRFVAGGRAFLDPINPQSVTRQDGRRWSRFFTEYCSEILSFERWEVAMLERLTNYILPFRSIQEQHFLDIYYNGLDRQSKATQYARAYRLGQPVGVANFIDKIVSRAENHRLADYKICLELIDRVMRLRDPYEEPAQMPDAAYEGLYESLAADDGSKIAGWDYSRYASPRFFLQLLRRHTYTGAFSHPKHGGNAGGIGWAYLAGNLVDPVSGKLPNAKAPAPYFDWSRSQEWPLGRNEEYRG